MANQSSSATNLQGPNLNTAVTQPDANRYFNNFYSVDFSVGAANDVVTAFFEQYTGDATAGKNLAAAVLYTAKAQNLDPLVVLGDFQALPKNQLSTYLAAFLNINRVPTSTIGIKSGTKTNPLVARTIIL